MGYGSFLCLSAFTCIAEKANTGAVQTTAVVKFNHTNPRFLQYFNYIVLKKEFFSSLLTRSPTSFMYASMALVAMEFPLKVRCSLSRRPISAMTTWVRNELALPSRCIA